MRILDNGDVWLKKGEAIPVYCTACEWCFQPGGDHPEIVDCPNCGREILVQSAPGLTLVIGDEDPEPKKKRRRSL